MKSITAGYFELSQINLALPPRYKFVYYLLDKQKYPFAHDPFLTSNRTSDIKVIILSRGGWDLNFIFVLTGKEIIES